MADVKNHSTLPTNLLSYWEMEEASGTRLDSTATGNDLTDNNTVGQGTGKQGSCADMESTNSEYLSHADVADWDLLTTNDKSVNMWIKTESDVSSAGLVTRWGNEGGGNKNLLFRLEATGIPKVYAGSGSSTGVSVSATTDCSDQAWHMVTMTWSGTVDDKFRLYVDGTLEGTSAAASPGASTSSIIIGGKTGLSGVPFDGLMDEVGWWNKALSQSEIDDLYNSGSGIPYEDATVGFAFSQSVVIV